MFVLPYLIPIGQHNMEITIALFHKGLYATFQIDKIDPVTFNARLKAYTGDKPPSFIKFYRTELGWRSAFEDVELIRELGMGVDNVLNRSVGN